MTSPPFKIEKKYVGDGVIEITEYWGAGDPGKPRDARLVNGFPLPRQDGRVDMCTSMSNAEVSRTRFEKVPDANQPYKPHWPRRLKRIKLT